MSVHTTQNCSQLVTELGLYSVSMEQWVNVTSICLEIWGREAASDKNKIKKFKNAPRFPKWTSGEI